LSAGDSVEIFRNASKADLRLGILSVAEGGDGFPLAIVNLRSVTSDEIIVTYGPGAVAIHCGPYVQLGPPVTYGIRREILDGYGFLDFPPGSSGWAGTSGAGGLELMHPTRLPEGSYDLWATVYLPGAEGGTLQTPHQVYTVLGAATSRR